METERFYQYHALYLEDKRSGPMVIYRSFEDIRSDDEIVRFGWHYLSQQGTWIESEPFLDAYRDCLSETLTRDQVIKRLKRWKIRTKI